MKFNNTEISDLYLIEYDLFNDQRGSFLKTYNKELFKKNNLCCSFEESFYSVSNKNVFRGMHFQTPPFDHVKLINVIRGSIIDIVLDIRKDSLTYGKYIQFDLSENDSKGLYIGTGLAHGFYSKDNNTIVQYHTSTVQDKDSESGIKWNSFGMKLNFENIIISDRDNNLPDFSTQTNHF
jgi:dTDP-4-dehydrorhamnose 3,5-epimerase